MITDMHCRLFGKEELYEAAKKEKAAYYSDGTYKDLSEKAKSCGVVRFAVMNAEERTADAIKFYTANGTEKTAEIGKLRSGGFSGVYIDPQELKIPVDSVRLAPVFESALSAGLAVSVRCGCRDAEYVYCTPKRLINVACRYGGSPLIFSHFCGIREWDGTAEELCGKDVYFDTAACAFYQPPGLIGKIISEHGADKILFGSDMPFCTPGLAAAQLGLSGIGGDGLELIKRINAERFLQSVRYGTSIS